MNQGLVEEQGAYLVGRGGPEVQAAIDADIAAQEVRGICLVSVTSYFVWCQNNVHVLIQLTHPYT